MTNIDNPRHSSISSSLLDYVCQYLQRIRLAWPANSLTQIVAAKQPHPTRLLDSLPHNQVKEAHLYTAVTQL